MAKIDVARNGSGCRDTARGLDISLNTVLRHLKTWEVRNPSPLATPETLN